MPLTFRLGVNKPAGPAQAEEPCHNWDSTDRASFVLAEAKGVEVASGWAPMWVNVLSGQQPSPCL